MYLACSCSCEIVGMAIFAGRHPSGDPSGYLEWGRGQQIGWNGEIEEELERKFKLVSNRRIQRCCRSCKH